MQARLNAVAKAGVRQRGDELGGREQSRGPCYRERPLCNRNVSQRILAIVAAFGDGVQQGVGGGAERDERQSIGGIRNSLRGQVPSGKISMPVAGIPMPSPSAPSSRPLKTGLTPAFLPSLNELADERGRKTPLCTSASGTRPPPCSLGTTPTGGSVRGLTCSRRAKRRCRSARAGPLWGTRGAGTTSSWNKVCIPNHRVRSFVVQDYKHHWFEGKILYPLPQWTRKRTDHATQSRRCP